MSNTHASVQSILEPVKEQVHAEPGNGGLTRLVVSTAAAKAELYLYGAHVTHYQPRGQRPVLFLSSRSQFTPGKPIRGGVPICFPWFGPKADDPGAPMHGFARTSQWRLADARRVNDSAVSLALELDSTEQTRRLWPHDFLARYTVTIAETMEMALEVVNRSAQPLTFQEALHTYFSVGDVRQASVRGLENTRYFDKVAAAERGQGQEPIRFTGETDRVYMDTTAACAIEDPVLGRRLVNEKSGSRTTVVWNPWIEKSREMPDFGDDEWPAMLCVETANAGNTPVRLEPAQSHAIRARVSVEGL